MSYLYVKSPGAGSPTPTTLQTGAFPAAYYASIQAATTAGASGDIIMCAVSHAHTYTGVNTVLGIDNMSVYSVDETNCDQISAGASETVSGTYDITLLSTSNNYCYAEGITFASGDDFLAMGGTVVGGLVTLKDCILKITGTADIDQMRLYGGDGGSVTLIDCQASFGKTTQSLYTAYGSKVVLRGFSLDAGSPAITHLFDATGNGSSNLEIYDADLTGMAASAYLYNTLSSSDDSIHVVGGRIKTPAAFTLFDGVTPIIDYDVDLIGIDTTDAYYARLGENYCGTFTSDTGIYYGATYNGTNNYSVKLVTTANASVDLPLRIKLVSFPVSAATQTFTTHIARDDSTADFHTSEMWLEVEYPDSTDEALGVVVSTRDTTIGSTTDVATETGLWTGLGGTSAQMSLSSGSLTTGAGVVTVWLCCGVASQTLYVDPKVVIS